MQLYDYWDSAFDQKYGYNTHGTWAPRSVHGMVEKMHGGRHEDCSVQ